MLKWDLLIHCVLLKLVTSLLYCWNLLVYHFISLLLLCNVSLGQLWMECNVKIRFRLMFVYYVDWYLLVNSIPPILSHLILIFLKYLYRTFTAINSFYNAKKTIVSSILMSCMLNYVFSSLFCITWFNLSMIFVLQEKNTLHRL